MKVFGEKKCANDIEIVVLQTNNGFSKTVSVTAQGNTLKLIKNFIVFFEIGLKENCISNLQN